MKHNYNDTLNPVSYIRDIPFRFLSFRFNGANFRIGDSRQKVFIPRTYVNKDGTIKDDVNLDWWFYKPINQHKIALYKEEMRKEKDKWNIIAKQ